MPRISCALALLCLLSLAGCASTPTPPPAATLTPYPDARLPAQAPPSSKVRCESLPPLAVGTSANTRQLLQEIHRARSAYADCANRHNVLIDFTRKLEQGVVDIRNHYRQPL